MGEGSGYDATFDSWARSGRGMSKAADKLASATDELCRCLSGAGAPWGQDGIGRAFFNGGDGAAGFGAARDGLLSDMADMVNLVRATGGTLVVAGQNYRIAESASTIGGGLPQGADKGALDKDEPYHLPQVASGLVESDPPPAEYMQILYFLETLVGGCEWPDGSMSGLATIRDGLNTAAKAVGEVATDVGGHAKTVTDNNSGAAVDSFDSFAAALQGAGDEGGLLWLASALKHLGGAVDFLIKQKNAARLQFELSLAFLALTWLIALAISWITGGSSIPAAEAVTQAEGFCLRTFLQQVAKSVLVGMWFAGGMDGVGQFARIHEGVQKGFSGREFVTALGEGAIAGGVMGAAGAGVAARGTKLTSALADWMGAGGLKGAGTKFLFAGTTGTAGNLAAQGLVEHKVDLGQAAAFGFGMAGMGAFGDAGKSLKTHFTGGESSASPIAGDDGAVRPVSDTPRDDGPPPPPHDDGPPPSHEGPGSSQPGGSAPVPRTEEAYPTGGSEHPAGGTDYTGGNHTTMAGHQDPVTGGAGGDPAPRLDNPGGGSRIGDLLNGGHTPADRPVAGEPAPSGGVYNPGGHTPPADTPVTPVDGRGAPAPSDVRGGTTASRPPSGEPRTPSSEPGATPGRPVADPNARPGAPRSDAPPAGSTDPNPTGDARRPAADRPGDAGGSDGRPTDGRPAAGQPAPRDTAVVAAPVDHGVRETAPHGQHPGDPGPVHSPDAHGTHSAPLTPESLERSIQSGIRSSEDLGGGNAAESVRLVTFNDGRTVVEKTPHWTDEAHAEELASLVGQKIGAPVPHALVRGERTVYMDYMDGTPGREMHRDYENRPDLPYWDSPEGRRLGLLDLLVGNGDRNGYNWLVGGDQKVMGVDHGGAFDRMGVNPLENPFVKSYADPHGLGGYKVRDDHPLSREDIQSLRQSVEELRPDFERLGRQDWYADVMRRLDELEEPLNRQEPAGPYEDAAEPVRTEPDRPRSPIDELLNHRGDRHPGTAEPPDGHAPPSPDAAPVADAGPRKPLADSVASGVRHEEPLVQGRSADSLARVTFNDGTTAVRKQFRYPIESDAEALASRVGEALGVRTPRVHQDGLTVYMDEVSGRHGYEAMRAGDGLELVNTPEGRLLGLFDVLVQNPDRTGGNWYVGDGNELYGIDHSDSFRGVGPSPDLNRFAGHYVTNDRPGRPELAPENPLSPRDIETARQRLQSVKPEFDRLGRTDWHDAMMGRLDELGQRATGTDSFFAPDRPASDRPAHTERAPEAPGDRAQRPDPAPRAESPEPPAPVPPEARRDLGSLSRELGGRHAPETVDAATDTVDRFAGGAWRDAYGPIATEDLVSARLFAEGDHRPINTAYYGGDHAALEPYAEQVRSMDTVLDALPEYNGEVHRVVDLEPAQVARYRTGEVVHEPGYVIASANPHGQFHGNTEFVIQSRTGRAVGPAISPHIADQEVHFRRDTPFEVTTVEHLGGGNTRVHLRELADNGTPPGSRAAGHDIPPLAEGFGRRNERGTPHDGRPLDQSVASGVAERHEIPGGSSGARVEHVTFGDGREAVHLELPTKLDADREYLALRVGEAAHAPVPRAVRDGETGLYTERVGGRPAAERPLANDPELIHSDRGRLLGFFDVLIGNRDRSGFNWLVSEDHGPFGRTHAELSGGIDHRLAFADVVVGPGQSPFAEPFVRRGPDGRTTWSYSPMHRTDIAAIRPRLEALRPEFEALGHRDWYESMMGRFDKLSLFAAGERPLIPGHEPPRLAEGSRPPDGPGTPHGDRPAPEPGEHTPPARDDYGPIDPQRYVKVPLAELRPMRTHTFENFVELSNEDITAMRAAHDRVTQMLAEMDGGRPTTARDILRVVKELNPTGHRRNCPEAAMAVDDVLRGKPAVAGRLNGAVVPIARTAYKLRAIDSWPRLDTVQQMESIMLNAGPGARGIIIGHGGKATPHVYNIVNIDGKIYYLDGQEKRGWVGFHPVHDGRFTEYDLYRTG